MRSEVKRETTKSLKRMKTTLKVMKNIKNTERKINPNPLEITFGD